MMQVETIELRLSRLLVRLLLAGAGMLAIFGVAHAEVPTPALVSIIHAGRLLAMPGKPPVERVTVIVQDGKIKETRPGYLEPAALNLPPDTQIIDLTNMFVMPGFIDLHVHLAGGAEGGRDLALR